MSHAPGDSEADPKPPRRLRALRNALALRFLPAVISGALRVVAGTARYSYIDAAPLQRRWREGEQTLLAFWHNRVVMLPPFYCGRGVTILNSQSRDGEIATRALLRWKILSVRGSATRGGAGGFLKLLRSARQGRDLALVPDGPRGPRYAVKPGILHLARATGLPLYPVSYGASRFVQLKSWDRLLVPLPFSRVVYAVGQPFTVPRHATDEELSEYGRRLERELNRITEAAENQAGRRAD